MRSSGDSSRPRRRGGLSHVLVITGKGADQAASKSFYEEDERGVLRNAVPHWLAEPEFAALVVSFSPAPRRLGGDGALYVRLRRHAPGLTSGLILRECPSALLRMRLVSWPAGRQSVSASFSGRLPSRSRRG